MSIQIPLLIQDKLDYYRYYVPHRVKMRKLNRLYKDLIYYDDEADFTVMHKIYGISHRYEFYNYRFLTSDHLFAAYPQSRYYSINAYPHKPGFYDIDPKVFIPRLYQYSSGLNNRNGYF